MTKPQKYALLTVLGAAVGLVLMTLVGAGVGTSWWMILIGAAAGGYVGGLIRERRDR